MHLVNKASQGFHHPPRVRGHWSEAVSPDVLLGIRTPSIPQQTTGVWDSSRTSGMLPPPPLWAGLCF